MAVAQVATGSGSGSGTSLALTGVTCAAGNIIAIQVIAVNTGNNPVFVSSASDNAAAGNSYAIPAGASAGAFFSGQNQFASIATIWCQVVSALSASTVTINLSASAGVTILGSWSTYSGVQPGAGTQAAAAATQLVSVSSVASPSAAAGPLSLVIAGCNLNGTVSSASGGYAVLPGTPGNFGAWLGTSAAVTTSTTFTLSATDPVWSTTIVVVGPVAPPGAARRTAARTGVLPAQRRLRQQLPFAPAPLPPAYLPGDIAQRRQPWARSLPRHSRVTLVVPPQVNPPFQFSEIAQRRETWPRSLPRRAHATFVVPAQVNPPYPFAEIRQQRQPRGLQPRRGHGFTPVPAQQAATPAPPFTWQPLRHARLAAAPRRRLLVPPVPAQDMPVQRPRRSRPVLLPLRRGRTVAVTQGQHEPPRQRTVSRLRQPAQRRGHLTLVPPAQAAASAPPWVASHRPPLRAIALIRRRFRQLMPWPQAAQAAPSPGTLTAYTAPASTLTAGDAAESALTAATQSTGGPS